MSIPQILYIKLSYKNQGGLFFLTGEDDGTVGLEGEFCDLALGKFAIQSGKNHFRSYESCDYDVVSSGNLFKNQISGFNPRGHYFAILIEYPRMSYGL